MKAKQVNDVINGNYMNTGSGFGMGVAKHQAIGHTP